MDSASDFLISSQSTGFYNLTTITVLLTKWTAQQFEMHNYFKLYSPKGNSDHENSPHPNTFK